MYFYPQVLIEYTVCIPRSVNTPVVAVLDRYLGMKGKREEGTTLAGENGQTVEPEVRTPPNPWNRDRYAEVRRVNGGGKSMV